MNALEGLADLGSEGPSLDDVDEAAIEIDASDTNLDDIVGSVPSPLVEDMASEPALSAPEAPESDLFGSDGEAESAFTEEPSSPFDDPQGPTAISEELFEPPPPPSWSDVVQTCMGLGHARGGMLISPTGQVVAAHGSWPDPGPESIATKLVAMMDKTLKDAPTRSISAPLGGLHLTAWRVPLEAGLVTAAFIADAPLRAEARAPIDAQILAGGEF